MRHYLIGAALTALTSLTALTGAAADTRSARTGLVVVELFTSQGCSSCPPADALMNELADVKGVLPLSLHVDYWDYIGWKDEFAQAKFTKRQRAYAHAKGDRTIYTPQMIVQGRDHVVGYKPMKLADHIKGWQAQIGQAPVQLDLQASGEGLHLQAAAKGNFPAELIVQLVQFQPYAEVSIGRGENAGRTIEYTNIVTEWRQLTTWDGRAPLSMPLDVAPEMDTAVILQVPSNGQIVAAVAWR